MGHRVGSFHDSLTTDLHQEEVIFTIISTLFLCVNTELCELEKSSEYLYPYDYKIVLHYGTPRTICYTSKF